MELYFSLLKNPLMALAEKTAVAVFHKKLCMKPSRADLHEENLQCITWAAKWMRFQDILYTYCRKGSAYNPHGNWPVALIHGHAADLLCILPTDFNSEIKIHNKMLLF